MAMMFRVLHPLIWPTLAVLVLLAVSLRGRFPLRRGREQRCRRCDYELQGLPQTSTRCPECGADLQCRRATANGRRIAAWKVRLACLVLLPVTLWWGYRLLTPHRRLLLTPPAMLTKDPNLWTKIDQLAPWQVRGVFRRCMATPGVFNAKAAPQGLAMWRALSLRHDVLGDGLVEQCFRSAAAAAVALRPTVTQGDPIPLAFDVARLGLGSFRHQLSAASIGDVVTWPRTLSETYDGPASPLAGQVVSLSMLIDDAESKQLTPGPHTLRLTLETFYDVGGRRRRFESTVSRALTALPPGSPSVVLRDPEPDAPLLTALTCSANNRLDEQGHLCIEVLADLRRVTSPYCFDVFLEGDGKKHLVGVVYSSPDNRWAQVSRSIRFNWRKHRSYQIVLRPDPVAAAKTTHLTEIYGQELTVGFGEQTVD